MLAILFMYKAYKVSRGGLNYYLERPRRIAYGIFTITQPSLLFARDTYINFA